jgi:uncharacterized membrane protein
MPTPRKQPIDFFLEIFGILIVLASFILPAIYYSSLPDSLPRHFGSDGQPDAYGSKGIIWVLPSIGFILYLIIGLIGNVLGWINLPFNPDPEKIDFFQSKYSRMIRVINVIMVCLFSYVTYNTIEIGLGNQTQLPTYFISLFLIFLIGICLIYVLPDLLKNRKQK